MSGKQDEELSKARDKHGASGDCKSPVMGSTPTLASNLTKPRVRQCTWMENGIRTYINEYEPVPTLFHVIDRIQSILDEGQYSEELRELVQHWRVYTLTDLHGREAALTHRLAEASKENSRLKRKLDCLLDELAEMESLLNELAERDVP